MIIINFAHPLSDEHLQQIRDLTGQEIAQVIKVSSQVNVEQPLGKQIVEMADRAGLQSTQWQQEGLIINPPALNHSAVLLMAELHGRMGYFPTCMRMRPVPNSIPRKFEVAEVVSLQQAREEARARRDDGN